MHVLWREGSSGPKVPLSIYECFETWENDYCVQSTVMGSLCLITFFVTVYQCWKTVSAKYSPQLAIIILVLLQTLVLSVHYMFFRSYIALRFTQRYLHVITFCLIFFFFASLAGRVVGKQKSVSKILLPLLFLFLIGVSFIFGYSLAVSTKDGSERDISFMVLSTIYLILSIVFVIVGSLVTRTPTNTKTMAFRMLKSRRLWFLIVVNFIVSGLMFSADFFTVTEDGGDYITTHADRQGIRGNLALWIFHRVFTILLPIWAIILVIFSLPASARPTTRPETKRLTTPLLSDSGQEYSDEQLRQSLSFMNAAASLPGQDFGSFAFLNQTYGWESMSEPAAISVTLPQSNNSAISNNP